MAHKSEPGSPLNVALEVPSLVQLGPAGAHTRMPTSQCGSKGELKSQTAENVSVAQSSHHSEAEEGEVTDTVDLVSLLVGPTETLEASSMRCHLLPEPHVNH
jgi:hypothetical protein